MSKRDEWAHGVALRVLVGRSFNWAAHHDGFVRGNVQFGIDNAEAAYDAVKAAALGHYDTDGAIEAGTKVLNEVLDKAADEARRDAEGAG